MSKVVFPSFRSDEYTAFEMRQLVSALELRFNSLELATQESVIPDTDPVGGDFAPIDHTHTESDITDLQHVESIFDLTDVTGTPDLADVLIWDGAAFVPGPQGSGAIALNDLSNVNVPAPDDEDILQYDQGSGQWIAVPIAGGGVNTLADLTDTDLSGQATGDLLFNAGSNTWEPTGQTFQWVAGSYIQLGRDIGINWYDSLAASVEAVTFGQTVSGGAAITHAQASVFPEDTSIGTSFADVTGMTIPMSSLVSGDEYLIVAHANMGSSDTSGTHLGFRITNHDDTVLDNLPALNESEGTSSTGGLLVQHASVFTAGPTGSLDMQMYINSGTGGANHMSMFVMSLTELGASNWDYHSLSGLSINTGDVFVDTGVQLTVGNGVDDWLFISTIRTQSGGGAYTGKMRLDIGGTNSDRLSATFRGDAGESRTHTAQWVEQALPASTLVKVQADGDSFGVIEGGNLIAINLSAFATYQLTITDAPAIPAADAEYDQETLSFASNVAQADWAFVGACTAFPFTSGTSGNFGRHEIQVDVNSGGDTLVAWDQTYNQSSRATVGGGDNINGQTKMIWPQTMLNIGNGANVVADLRFDPNAGTAFANAGLTQTWLLAFPMLLADETEDQFILGDPSYPTEIDGSRVGLKNGVGVNWDNLLGANIEHLVFENATTDAVYEPQTEIYLSLDGTAGGTSYTDRDGNLWNQVTASATLNSLSKFGPTSLQIADGSAGGFEVADGTFIVPAMSGDFHMGFWYYLEDIDSSSTFTGGNTFFGQRTPGDTGWRWRININNGVLSFNYNTGGPGTENNFRTFGSALVRNAWTYIAIERVSGTIYAYLNSAQSGSSVADSNTLNAGDGPQSVLHEGFGSISTGDNVYIDDVLLLVGTNLYGGGATITPPASSTNPNPSTETFIVGDPSYRTQIDGSITTITGPAQIDGTTTGTGAATFESTLDVTGATTLSDTLGVTGAATLNSTLDVLGLSTLDGIVNTGTMDLGVRASGDATGRTILLEGTASAGGEGSGRIFFSEHNATGGQADSFGLSLYYEGDAAAVLPSGFGPNTGNATWSLRRHDNSVNGVAIMSGTRGSGDVTFAGGLTATSYGGILEANLLDKTANEAVTGDWTFEDQLSIINGADSMLFQHNGTDFVATGTNTVDFDVLGLTGEFFIDADLRTSGDLTVGGTTTTINSNTVSIADNIILLNSDATDPPTENAGLEIERGGVVNNVLLRWNETSDTWQWTNDGSTYSDMIDWTVDNNPTIIQVDNLAPDVDSVSPLYPFVTYDRSAAGINYDDFLDSGTFGEGGGATTNDPNIGTFNPFFVMRNSSDVRVMVELPRNNSNPIAYRGYHTSAWQTWHYTGWTTTLADADLSIYAKTADIGGGSIPSGTVTSSTLRWSGSAWVESTAVRHGSANIEIRSGAPTIWFYETDATAANQNWYLGALSERFVGRVYDDAFSSSFEWLTVERTANVVDSITFNATEIRTEDNFRIRSGGNFHINTDDNVGTALTINPASVTTGTTSITSQATGLTQFVNDWVFNTSSDTAPLNISRTGSITNEVLQIGLTDVVARYEYFNDEISGTMSFALDNSDTETGGGAGANTHSMNYFGSDALSQLTQTASAAQTVEHRMRNATYGVTFDLDGAAGGFQIQQTNSASTVEDIWISMVRNGGVQLRYNNTAQVATTALGTQFDLPLYLFERASANTDSGTFGQIWVNSSDSHLYFTTDGGTDYQISGVAGGGTIGGSIANDQVAVGAATANEIEGFSNFTYNGTTLALPSGAIDVDTVSGTTGVGNRIDGGNYDIRAGTATGGWARALRAVAKSDGSIICAAGFLGTNEALTQFAIGDGATWYQSPDAFMTIDGTAADFYVDVQMRDIDLAWFDSSQPWISLDSVSAGDNWSAQGAGISVGESGKKGSAAIHMTYNGDGSGYVGMGTVDDTAGTGGRPAFGHLDFTYNNHIINLQNRLYILGGTGQPWFRVYDDTDAEYVEIATTLTQARMTAFSGSSILFESGTTDILTLATGTSTLTSQLNITGTADGVNIPQDGLFDSTLLELYNTNNDVILNCKGTSSGNDLFISANDGDNRVVAFQTGAVGLYYGTDAVGSPVLQTSADVAATLTRVDVEHADGNLYDVGLAKMPILEQDTSITLGNDQHQKYIHCDASSGTIQYTVANNSNIQTGTTWMISNETTSTAVVQIITSSATLRWFDGSGTPSTGTRTLARGGVCTIIKYGTSEYHIWGIGLS